MSEKIIVKLRRDNISVSSCKEGVYLTFDAENARPIICKYSEVITIFTPNQIYDVEDIMLMLGPVLHSFLEKAKISTGLLHWESANPFVKLRSRAVKDYVLILNEIRKIAIEDDLKAIVISLDDRAFPDFLLKKQRIRFGFHRCLPSLKSAGGSRAPAPQREGRGVKTPIGLKSLRGPRHRHRRRRGCPGEPGSWRRHPRRSGRQPEPRPDCSKPQRE